MIGVKECTDKAEWDEYLLDNDGHPLQLWGWGEVKSRHGWSVDRLFVYDEDEIIAAFQVLTKKIPLPFRAFSYIPRASIFHVKYEDSLEVVAQYVKQKNKSIALSIEPNSLEFNKPEKWVRATNKILSPETVLLDITQNEDALQSIMAKKTRQYIRKSVKDVEIRLATSEEDVEACLDLYEVTAQRAGFALHNRAYYRDVWESMGDHSPLFMAFSDGKPVAFLWLVISGTTAYELYGGVDDMGQKLRANYALKWHAISKVKQWGLTQYDFGGMVAGGVATFKQGWTESLTVFAGTYDRPLSSLYILWSHTLPFAKRAVQKARRLARR